MGSILAVPSLRKADGIFGVTLSDVPLKGRGGFFLAALCLDRNDVHPMLQKEIDLPIFVTIVSRFHRKLSSELLQDIVFREQAP